MRIFTKLHRRFEALLNGGKKNDELSLEIEQHLEMEIAELVAEGMKPKEARLHALREFGNVECLKEDCRESWGTRVVFDLIRDVRYAVRHLLKSPGFSLIAIVSLALGIGANIGIFSIANGILMRSLPVENPSELRLVKWTGQNPRIQNFSGYMETSDGGSGNYGSGSFRIDNGRWATVESFPGPRYQRMRDATSGIAEVFGYAKVAGVTSRVVGQPFTMEGLIVTDNFFKGIGLRAHVGRLFVEGASTEESATTAVISYQLWQREYAGDPGAIGKPITLNKKQYSIIGVTPPKFNGVSGGESADFYVSFLGGEYLLPWRSFEHENHWWVRVMARVSDAVSDEQLRSRMATVFSEGSDSLMEKPNIVIEEGDTGANSTSTYYRKPLLLLLGVVGVVALVTCANLAGLCLARGVARQHELAVRAALGARNWILGRHLFLETAILAFVGGLVGTVLSIWIRNGVLYLMPQSEGELRYDFSLDVKVYLFAVAIVALTAILSGLLPALRASRIGPQAGFGARSTLSAPKLRSGRYLVVAQMAFSVALVVIGALFVRSFLNLTSVDSGFSEENVLLASVSPDAVGIEGDDATLFWEQASDRILEIPGVLEVGVSEYALLSGSMSGGTFFGLPGMKDESGEVRPNAHRLVVNENFLSVIGIPILQGREIRRGDVKGSQRVVLVNETFSKEYFPEKGALGQQLTMGEESWEIVGICGDAHYTTLQGEVPATVYFSFRQWPYGLSAGYFSIQTIADPYSLVEPLKEAIASLNSDLPVTQIATQKQMRARSVKPERTLALLVSILGSLALFLSCLGVFGLMAYNVKRRIREIGIRVALGAKSNVVARTIRNEALVMGFIGIALGLPMAFVASRFATEMLVETTPYDPYAYIASVLALMSVTWLAAWAPAKSASQMDPMVALRAG